MAKQKASSCYTFTLGLGGASCTGKTTIATKLKQRHTHTVLVHQDNFYKSVGECVHTADMGPLWDDPEALKVGRLQGHLGQVQENPTVFCEACSREGHGKGADCCDVHLVVVEGTMVLNLGCLESMMDVRVYIDTTLELCASRRRCSELRRDYETTEVPGYLEKYAWPAFERGRQELVGNKQAGSCDASLVLIDGTGDVALSDLEATIWEEIQQRMHQMQQMSTEAR